MYKSILNEDDLKEIERKMAGICRYLGIKLITEYPNCFDTPYTAVKHWPFEGGFPVEPLHNLEEHERANRKTS